MNRQVIDLIDSIPLGVCTEKEHISHLLRTAYWRGVNHQRTDPRGTEKYMNDQLTSHLNNINLGNINKS